ncbi:MAG: hypothetical protein U1F43_21965 [Myxococcota bacterium]
MQFINYNERIGPLAIGTFALDAAPDDNFGTCAECIALWVDQPDITRQPSKFVFQKAGSIRLDLDPRTRRLKAHIEGLQLQEITLDPQTLSSTFVPGGTCAFLTAPLDFDFRWVPPEWTCAESAYNSGDGCDCGCGAATDPDCYDADYQQVPEWRGCAEGEVCQDGACRVPCSAFAPTEACAVGTCVIQMPRDLCSSNTSTDPAHLGEPCTRSGALACAVEAGIMRGVCSGNDDTSICRPICQSRFDCAADEYCYTIYGGTKLGEGKGYCVGGLPPGWLCDPSWRRDGATCDCGCGDIDPDCDVPGRPLRGCDAGQVCDDQATCVAPP